MAEFTAHYERKFSDGNFGSEGYSLSWSWINDDEDSDPTEGFGSAGEFLRRMVLEQLAKSASYSVAAAAKRELEAPEREARARESAEYELAAGLRDNARGDNDDEEPF
jgi:hypothetical protein